MAVMVLITFLGTNLQAILWQSSEWLVSTVLPAVVVDLTNDERADNNAVPLRRNATLDRAAQLKAQHMANNEYFAHYAPDGTSPWYWFDTAGYRYAHAGENLAIHFTDSAEVVDAWMKSPSHRKNIVDGKFTEIGVGTAKGEFDGFDTVYVVQLFGTPAAAPVATPEPVTTQPAAAAEAPAVEVVAVDSEVVAVEETSTSVLAVETEPEVVVPASEPVEVIVEPEPQEVVTTQPVEAQEEVVSTKVTPESEIVTEIAAEPTPTPVAVEDVVVIETPLMTTSSGLAVASITEAPAETNSPIAGFITRPHLVLEVVYALLAVIVVTLLLISLFMEARKVHPVQVAYSTGMLATMALLLWVHTTLISGAVIV